VSAARTESPHFRCRRYQPRWHADGNELFYLDADNRIMAMPVTRLETDRQHLARRQRRRRVRRQQRHRPARATAHADAQQRRQPARCAHTGLIATKPKAIVIGRSLRSARDTRAARAFNERADALPVIELPPHFSTDDAGSAGTELLRQVQTVIGATATSVAS